MPSSPEKRGPAPTWVLVVGVLLLIVGAVAGQAAKKAALDEQMSARGLDPRRHRPSAEDERAASDSPAVLLPAAGLGGVGCVLIATYFVKRRRSRRRS